MCVLVFFVVCVCVCSSFFCCVCVCSSFFHVICCVCVFYFLPVRASEQGNVIGLVSVYIYIYI